MPIIGPAQLGKILGDNSRVHTQFIHKTSHADGGAGDFIDLSMAAGTPKFNAYVGDQAAFTPMQGSGNFGIYTGEAEPGRTKYLTHWWLQTMSANNIPGTFHMLDYIGFYPLIDLDSTDVQELENLVPLTRHTDGKGLRLMLVITTPSASNADFTVSYTNELGVVGRIASGSVGVGAFTGNIITATESTFAAGKRGPFLALANGDTGVQSVQSITFAASAGGFAALVLVRPLAELTLLESPTVTESDLLMKSGRVVDIADDAYLNMIFTTGGSITPAILRGGITVARN
jgi:hypothetical protein